jgi:hypothetical protein
MVLRRIEGLAVSLAPYAELSIEALLFAVTSAYHFTLIAFMAARGTLKRKCTETVAAAASKVAVGSEERHISPTVCAVKHIKHFNNK